jgi:hypothetical protein
MYILTNYEKVFRQLDNKKAKNYVNLSEKELRALLQLMFELGIQYNKISAYDFDSYVKKFYNKLSYKRGIQLYCLLGIIMKLHPNKSYKPKQLNNITSNFIRNYIPHFMSTLGIASEENSLEIKNSENLFSSREMTELLQILKDDLKMLKNVKGRKKITENHISRPGRKDSTLLEGNEGFPSIYRISDEFLMIKALFRKSESVSLLRDFINNNKIIKKYFIFYLSIILYNSSEIINKTVRAEYKEKLQSEIYKKLKLETEFKLPFLLLLWSKKEIKSLSINIIDTILSKDDYTFLLFLIKLSAFIHKLNINKSKLKVAV